MFDNQLIMINLKSFSKIIMQRSCRNEKSAYLCIRNRETTIANKEEFFERL